ncbi:isopenicillin N synthase family dioxygenase [Streptomyces sp. NPDC058583]|uniref:isopenicillin N synthase family dioxygenase n=1 Tax=unclassified Streptomyces TaxID=2593676 RepID=UPI0036642846
MSEIFPVIDLTPWFEGDSDERAKVAEQVDEALRTSGILLVTGHRVPVGLRAEVRAVAREFFTLPADVKARSSIAFGGRGWIAPRFASAEGYEGTAEMAPDLKESFSFGADEATGDDSVDARWFRPNTWPAEVPGMRPVVSEYIERMRALSDELMSLCAVALGLDAEFFAPHLDHPTYGFNFNRYPPVDPARPPAPGQFNVAPHTDFGTITVLDREPGPGGLQVFTPEGAWADAPYHPDALTVNIGDLLARWTGDRWHATRHRVLPPQAVAPEDDLISLVYFYETNHNAVIESMEPPVGRTSFPPVLSHEYLRSRLASIAPKAKH